MPKKGQNKAKRAAAALKSAIKRKRRLRRTVHFHKCQTTSQPRAPKYQRRSVVPLSTDNGFSLIKYPLTTEHAMKKIEDENTLVFVVKTTATKNQIKSAVKDEYEVAIDKVNTLIRPDGLKKAYIKLSSDHDALDVA